MHTPKPLTLTLLLLLLFLSSRPATTSSDYDDDDVIEQLIALDEEESQSEHSIKSSEAEVLTRAQRVVTELNHESTKRVIDTYEFVMVLGYAPWCERSAEMMPRFAEAAVVLKGLGSRVLMSKIDGDRFSKRRCLHREIEIQITYSNPFYTPYYNSVRGEMMPRLAEAAMVLKGLGSRVMMAKIDAHS